MTTPRPVGIVAPLATPLDLDERLDRVTLAQHLEWVLPLLDGVFVLGTSGEFALLRSEVADAMVDATVAQVAGRLPVYVGVGDTGTTRALGNLRRARDAGATYAVACGPYYYSATSPEALAAHFEAIADASELPVLLYNIPQNTVSALTGPSVARLALHPNIAGIKDSSGDLFQFQRFLDCRSDSFRVLQGREQLAAASLWLGADGIISTLANFAPRLLQQLRTAVDVGDRSAALALQDRITALARVFDQGHWVSALKGALAELGMGGGRPAAPLPACTVDQRIAIRALLDTAGIAGFERVDG